MSKDIIKKTEPKILPGFMELLPNEQIAFNQMIDSIKASYEKFGFLPIDTPIIEKAEVLLAKTGGETEKQIYAFKKGEENLALRFDLTVPLARFVAQYQNELTFPFRRYQIGKVYRGERNQRGRFREFYQCDVDIVGDGKLSLASDGEMVSVIYQTFKALGFENFTIKINNRKILNGFFQNLNIKKSAEVLRVIDKLEKIGKNEAEKELIKLKISDKAIKEIFNFIQIAGGVEEVIKKLKSLNIENEIFIQGVKEIEEVIGYIKKFEIPEKNYCLALTIARGLDYYTGTVCETILNDYQSIGSVCSGGRYDDLAKYYTDRKLPGVGISIGLTRLFYQLKEAGLIKLEKNYSAKVIVIALDDNLDYAAQISSKLREKNINTEIYLEDNKAKKKFSYADKLNIPFAVVVGENEAKAKKITLKNLTTGEQLENISFDQAIKIITK